MIWGIGIDGSVGGDIFAGLKGEVTATFVWDHCGGSGILFTIQGAGTLEVGINPANFSAHVHLLSAVKVSISGQACVKDLDGWAGGVGGQGGVIVEGTVDVDVTQHGLIVGRVGAGLSSDIHVGGDVHVTYKVFLPLGTAPCPCNLSWWETGIFYTPIVSPAYFLGKAIGNWLTSTTDDEEEEESD